MRADCWHSQQRTTGRDLTQRLPLGLLTQVPPAADTSSLPPHPACLAQTPGPSST